MARTTTCTDSARTPCEWTVHGRPRASIDRSGYKSSPFPAKAAQQDEVAKILAESGFLPRELVTGEVDWFYNHLGIGESHPYRMPASAN